MANMRKGLAPWNKRYTSCYSRPMGDDHYGLVKKQGSEWHGEVRSNSTGEVVRFAGIWNTRAEAFDEIHQIMKTWLYLEA